MCQLSPSQPEERQGGRKKRKKHSRKVQREGRGKERRKKKEREGNRLSSIQGLYTSFSFSARIQNS